MCHGRDQLLVRFAVELLTQSRSSGSRILDRINALVGKSFIQLGNEQLLQLAGNLLAFCRRRRVDGAAFSILEHQRWFFIGVNIILFCAAAVYYRRISGESAWVRYGSALLFGGAVGNLIDRLRLGAVIDFFDFRIWPVFNIADIGICVGVGMMMYAIAFLSQDEED